VEKNRFSFFSDQNNFLASASARFYVNAEA